ncbi:FAD-dependent monooxygenase [Allostreptomyces psammosilenae]|uniref:2-polyprenyl-6-methoxyphenol hydroxylase-like FAD-dependent oxidoreductase n=1 Tax=Allostreptomyces psammosilenae TaxID=1892865 RepID=A0A852ZSV2_9ACTN|nr:FAD-dependent monooxygenase [Allostreptomyces psammosilenae]NYI04905.1 2-polyprenyl-6-methoxyphenol hydroxylase-like FAD-dependent oxidoreductase [Allostreptomyces psammosilenae]
MAKETEVLVVGAGPTGLTLAAGLLRRGIRVRIIDQAARSNPHSKAVTLWPRAIEVFDALGVGDRIFGMGVKLSATSYWTRDRQIGRVPLRPLQHTRYPVPISLPQNQTEAVLRDVVTEAGGRIEFGRRLASLENGPDGVVATLEDGETISASWLVGCDGAHSTVRDQVGVRFEGETYPQSFVLVDGEYDTEYVHDESYYVMGRTGVMVVVGLPGGLYRVFASVPPGQKVEDVEKTVEAIIEERSPLRLRQTKSAGSGLFQIHRKLADRMRVGRVLLAGDAAHIHSPAGGLGMNTGVQDAYSAAWRLAGVLRGSLDASQIDEWERERLFVARGVVTEADRQTQMWMMQGWQRQVRDALIRVGIGSGVLERVMPPRMAQMTLVLPGGDKATGRLRPGARIPDVALGPDRLYSRLSGGGHLLLLFTDEVAAALKALGIEGKTDPDLLRVVAVTSGAPRGGVPEAVSETVTDVGGRIRRALGAPSGAVCLVRPDTVIAAAAVASDETGRAALRSRLPRPAATPEPEYQAD